MDHVHGFIYYVCFEILKMFVPMCVLFTIYSLSAAELTKNQRSFVRRSLSNLAGMQRIRRNKQIVIMFVTVVVIFFLCNGPYSIFVVAHTYIITYKYRLWNREAGNLAHSLLYAIASASSVVNPIIYARMHREIRGPMRMLLRRGVACQKEGLMFTEKKQATRTLSLNTTQISMKTLAAPTTPLNKDFEQIAEV